MKFCFHSTRNEILFPLHSKQNSVSGLPYSLNPNTAAFAAGCLGWGGENRPHASLVIAGLDGNDNRNGDCLGKKRGWTREKERGKLKMGLFFHAVLFCYCFLAFLF
jgi:hypothetical protein